MEPINDPPNQVSDISAQLPHVSSSYHDWMVQDIVRDVKVSIRVRIGITVRVRIGITVRVRICITVRVRIGITVRVRIGITVRLALCPQQFSKCQGFLSPEFNRSCGLVAQG